MDCVLDRILHTQFCAEHYRKYDHTARADTYPSAYFGTT